MSVITRVSVHSHCNDLGGKVWNPAITWTKKYAVFITLENEQGITGLGECWCFDTSPDVLVAYLRTEICPHIVGKDVQTCYGLYKQLLSRATLTARHGLLASAWSGIDIALWDLQSRENNLPLWKYLASQNSQAPDSHGQVYLYASGGLYGENKSVDDLASEMASMNSSGFDIVKMKIGGLSIAEDLVRINAVLESISECSKLIVDGVYSYSETEALKLFNALPANRIDAFQSPVKADELTGMKSLHDAGVPVMATEAEYRCEIHQQLIQSGAVKYLQTAPIACGGIYRLRQLNELISRSAAETLLSLEVSSTAVALMAACHFAASHTVAHVEYHYLHQVFFDQLNLQPVAGMRGWFTLPDKPGLGMALPESDIQTVFTQT